MVDALVKGMPIVRAPTYFHQSLQYRSSFPAYSTGHCHGLYFGTKGFPDSGETDETLRLLFRVWRVSRPAKCEEA